MVYVDPCRADRELLFFAIKTFIFRCSNWLRRHSPHTTQIPDLNAKELRSYFDRGVEERIIHCLNGV